MKVIHLGHPHHPPGPGGGGGGGNAPLQGLDIEVLAETIGEIRALWQVSPLLVLVLVVVLEHSYYPFLHTVS